MLLYALAEQQAGATGKGALFFMGLLQLFSNTALMALSRMEQHTTKKASHPREELLTRMDAFVLAIQPLLRGQI
jgi:hypothetical protein